MDPDTCPVCGATLEEVYIDYRRVLVCEDCGWTHEEWSYITRAY